MGSRRLLGRRLRSQAACRSSSGLSSGSESRDRIECRIIGAAVDLSARRPDHPEESALAEVLEHLVPLGQVDDRRRLRLELHACRSPRRCRRRRRTRPGPALASGAPWGPGCPTRRLLPFDHAHGLWQDRPRMAGGVIRAVPSEAGLMSPTIEERAKMDEQNAALREALAHAPKLSLEPTPVAIKPPQAGGWALGMVSWVASDRSGLIYLLQRGDKADPVLVVDRTGKIVRSWGKGMYTTPHAIRLDPQGNVWTTDAASSMVYKFSPGGQLLMKIEVGGQPAPCNGFCSTTDIAFASDGHLLIADGYRNARILEYSADGKKLREWGRAGMGPGQFRLPHSIQIDDKGVIYVADRENGRIQRFDREGQFLDEWTTFGKTFGLTLAGDTMWLSSIPRGPNGAPGWLIKVDRASGKLLGYVDAVGNHGMDVMANGDVLQSPGPNEVPQVYRSSRGKG
ncbi:MAG TPA: peptidyl-alpha-hydroxyglycine alpha-amidating lyase family protein [Methylomirabilota bacterium]|nr:peptidyl-alpha-hydroxyglycine alpha-amidating lyase family protein [Methylomirabilota bacterium]